VTCVIATEGDRSAGVKPVEWRLLSSCIPTGRDELATTIDWYRARWEIEMFFNALKNGCTVEAMQLSMVERLERTLALIMIMIVAWRIAYLMRLGRTCPDLDEALFFDQDEIRGAYPLMKKRRPPHPPRLNEMVRLISVHSANASAVEKMRAGFEAIEKLASRLSSPGNDVAEYH